MVYHADILEEKCAINQTFNYMQHAYYLSYFIIKISIYQLANARFDWFRNSRCEIIFTGETIDEIETKYRKELVA